MPAGVYIALLGICGGAVDKIRHSGIEETGNCGQTESDETHHSGDNEADGLPCATGLSHSNKTPLIHETDDISLNPQNNSCSSKIQRISCYPARFLTRCLLLLIRAYQVTVSPYLGNVCRFEPSCSQYMYEALQRKGLIKGLWLGIRRLLRCHPFNAGGYDPVPK